MRNLNFATSRRIGDILQDNNIVKKKFRCREDPNNVEVFGQQRMPGYLLDCHQEVAEMDEIP